MEFCIACGAPRLAAARFCTRCGASFAMPHEGESADERVTRLQKELTACQQRGIERLDVATNNQSPVDARELEYLARKYTTAKKLHIPGRVSQIKQMLWDALTQMEKENAADAQLVRELFFGGTPSVVVSGVVKPGFIGMSPMELLEKAAHKSGISEFESFRERLETALRNFAAFLITFCDAPTPPAGTQDPPPSDWGDPTDWQQQGQQQPGGYPPSPPYSGGQQGYPGQQGYTQPPPGPQPYGQPQYGQSWPGPMPPYGASPAPPASAPGHAARAPKSRRQRGSPARRHKPAEHPDDVLSRAVKDAVRPGLLTFNPPAEMIQGQKDRIEVGIARSVELREALATGLRGRGDPQFEELDTSPSMGVELKGPSFEIMSLSPTEQLVAPLARWEFDVRPCRFGLQTLILCVSLRIDSPLTPGGRMAVPVLERYIRIRVDVGYGTRRFLAANWQWLIATVVALGGALAAWVAFFR